MIEIDLTNQQRQYLLFLSEQDNKETLTSIAKHFNCSKVNSKKILDRMVKIGVIYKEDKRIILTDLGAHIANSQRETRDEIALVLEEGLSIERNNARDLANTMLIEESRGLRNRLLEVARYFVKLGGERQGASLKGEEVVGILGKGEFKAYFVIFQEERHDDDSFTPLSMAMRGFYEDAVIAIDEALSGKLLLKARPLSKVYEGVAHYGKPKIVTYRDEGKEYSVPVGETCALPFNLFKNWYYTGGGMLQSCLWLDMIPTISIEHKHTAKFVFTINLFNL